MTMALAERSWCVVVPHHARGARTARHRLTTALTGVAPPALLADMVAVLAELVGNAVLHADPLPGGVVRVAWRLRTGGSDPMAEIRVTDGGAPEAPHLRELDPEATEGRGLQIVAALSTRWGVERDGLGRCVWAELTAAAADAA